MNEHGDNEFNEKIILSFGAWQMLHSKKMDDELTKSRLYEEMYDKNGEGYEITKEDVVNFINKILKEKEEFGI